MIVDEGDGVDIYWYLLLLFILLYKGGSFPVTPVKMSDGIRWTIRMRLFGFLVQFKLCINFIFKFIRVTVKLEYSNSRPTAVRCKDSDTEVDILLIL